MKLHLILFFCYFYLNILICYGQDEELEEFIPTHEWQRIKEGQAIPPGLHIKMDLEKGGTWAKLNDDSKNNKDSGIVAVNKDAKEDEKVRRPKYRLNQRDEAALKFWKDNLKEVFPQNDKSFSFDDLKSAVKNLKTKSSEEYETDVKEKFRPIEEIREDLKELNINLKTDYEVMKSLVQIYQNKSSPLEEKLNALKDLEFYVHQVDNAVDFVKMDGLADVIVALNHTSADIRQEAALIIGAAVQSNPSVQVAAIELGALSQLSAILAETSENFKVRKSSLFAISCLIRRFPVAQTFFAKSGGFNAIMQLFKSHQEKDIKLQMKAIRLLNDLILERLQLTEEDSQYEEKLRQYSLLPMKSLIEDMHLCSELVNLLEVEDHNQIETVLEALKNFKYICLEELELGRTRSRLKTLEKLYKNLAKAESIEEDNTDDYYKVMTSNLEILLQPTNFGKTEL